MYNTIIINEGKVSNMKKKQFFIILTLCFIILSSVSPAFANRDMTEDNIEKLVDKVIKNDMENLHIPGAAIVMTKDDQIIFSKGYGYADLENKIPVNPEKTIIRVGSLTKSLTATAAMQLVEEEKFNLDKDINQYLKSYKVSNFNNKPITLHHLLTHTAGLDEAIYKRDSLSKENVLSSTEYLKNYVKKQPPICESGKTFQYSNVGIGLIGNLIEQRTGQTLNGYFNKNMFNHLDMSSASLQLPFKNKDLAKSYIYHKNKYKEMPYSYISLPGAGGMSSTATDFAKYMIMHINGGKYQGKEILHPDLVRQMHQKNFASHPDMYGIGYGFFRSELNGLPILWANGGIDGFNSKMVLIPSKGIGIFIVINSGQSGMEMSHNLIQVIADKFLKGDKKDISYLPNKSIEELEGIYELTLSPKHGYGKWFEFIGNLKYSVIAESNSVIKVKGVFQNEGQRPLEKHFIQTSPLFFQEIDGVEQIHFHKRDGKLVLTGPMYFTATKTPLWKQASLLRTFYFVNFLFFILMTIIWLIRWVIKKIRKKNNSISLWIGLISALNAVFFIIQFTYGNSKLLFGYSNWYILVICSIPIITAILASGLLMVNVKRFIKKEKFLIGQFIFCIVTLLCSFFLYYWNYLIVPYS
ncbi:MAG: penicillin-binding protein [Firmicutes bacterium]|nr:penicillin-binding protein [Bacillota bacterium]